MMNASVLLYLAIGLKAVAFFGFILSQKKPGVRLYRNGSTVLVVAGMAVLFLWHLISG